MSRAAVVAALALAGLLLPGPASSGTDNPTSDPAVEASVSETSVEVTIRHDGVLANIPLAAEPLADCSFSGPVTADEVLALLAVSVAARVAELDEAADYVVVSCGSQRFGGAASAVWPIGQDPPPEVVEILAQAAVARLTIPEPVPMSAPDGADTPFLVHLPVWFWLDEGSWQSRTATASLGLLGASATAMATPDHTRWSPGDGSPGRICRGPGEPWRADAPTAGELQPPNGCGHTYTGVTWPERPIEIRATAVYDLDMSCVPARICNDVELPSSLGIASVRRVHVAQMRGVITR